MIEYLEEPYTVIDRPLWWHERGLSQTASGYGHKLTSPKMVRLADGRLRRIYVTCCSNIGSSWITLGKRRLYLRG